MNSGCLICGNPVKVDQTIVGLPVIRVTATAKSQLTGGEIVIHLVCLRDLINNLPKPLAVA